MQRTWDTLHVYMSRGRLRYAFVSGTTARDMDIKLSPNGLGYLQGVVIVILLTAHLAVQIARFVSGDHSLFGLVTMFSLGSDRNLPTFYASFALLLCAVLLAIVARVPRPGRRGWEPYWCGLAVIFVFLSVDEILEIHERLIAPMRALFNTSGVLHYAWVIPYGAATLIFVAVYSRFLWRLPEPTRALFLGSGAVFVGGALGMEMVGAWHSVTYGNDNITYVVYQTIEEMLELIGIAIFMYAIADFLVRHCGGLRLRLALKQRRPIGGTGVYDDARFLQ